MVVVPDASVILKWVLQKEEEPNFLAAFQILEAYQAERIDIRLPSLWRYETSNILVLKQPTFAEEAMKLLLAYDFPEEALHRDYCLAVIDFMKGIKGVSFYDAAYHVLALQVEGTYVTADARYVEKTHRKSHVRLLSKWSAVSSR